MTVLLVNLVIFFNLDGSTEAMIEKVRKTRAIHFETVKSRDVLVLY